MKFGLQWFRRRQRSLARGVLALFCAAWLQAAIVPCVMAHAATPAAAPAPDHAHAAMAGHAHAAMAGHDHAAMAAAHAADGDAAPCIYCPPSEDAHGSCDGHDCSFPHDPQVDARAAGVLSLVLPVAFVLPTAGTGKVASGAGPTAPEAIPRISLAISYCRFIE